MLNPIIELFKNRKVQISKRCENVKSKDRIIQKMWNIKKINAALGMTHIKKSGFLVVGPLGFYPPYTNVLVGPSKKIAGNIAEYPSNNLLN